MYAPLEEDEQDLKRTSLGVSKSAKKRAKGQDGRTSGSQEQESLLECSVTAAFFNDHTHVRSGAKNKPRQLQMSKDEMYGLYRAHFPDLVRQAAARQAADPELHGPLSGFLTERLKVANEMSAVPLWSQVEELGRREEWYSRRTDEMRFERAANGTKSPQRNLRAGRPRQHKGSELRHLAHAEEMRRAVFEGQA